MKPKYPANATVEFMELCDLIPAAVQGHGLHPSVGPVLAAQLALESGWGTSKLAVHHKNFAGMKWRPMMTKYAVPVTYTDWQNKTEKYCKFKRLDDFLNGFFWRLDKLGPYEGWRPLAQKGGMEYIAFVGPIWLGMSPQQNQEYVRKVIALTETRFGG